MCRILPPDSLRKEKRNYYKTLHLPNFCYLFERRYPTQTVRYVFRCCAVHCCETWDRLKLFQKKKDKLGLKKHCESVVRRKENSFIF